MCFSSSSCGCFHLERVGCGNVSYGEIFCAGQSCDNKTNGIACMLIHSPFYKPTTTTKKTRRDLHQGQKVLTAATRLTRSLPLCQMRNKHFNRLSASHLRAFCQISHNNVLKERKKKCLEPDHGFLSKKRRKRHGERLLFLHWLIRSSLQTSISDKTPDHGEAVEAAARKPLETRPAISVAARRCVCRFCQSAMN